jgi:hypothetical protein
MSNNPSTKLSSKEFEMSLEKLLNEELPLNRKERFFTGTVLPMIVCKDSFKYLHALLSLIGVDEPLNISVEPGNENILFFSEYSFIESVAGEAQKRFSNLPTAKNTPDIIIFIKNQNKKILIAIEAKMYDIPTSISLKQQMDNQGDILNYIANELNIDTTCHVALLPANLYNNVDTNIFHYKMITWEDVHSKYKTLIGEDYFLKILSIALDNYDNLVSKGLQFRKNCEELYTGKFIYDGYKNGTLNNNIFVMGRDLGLSGPKLLNDVRSGEWENRKYETSLENKPINRHWFYVKDFIKLVDKEIR